MNDLNLLVVSDTHINATVGLLTPSAKLTDGMGVQLSKPQVELYKAWCDSIETLKNAKHPTFLRNIETVVILLGDMVETDYKDRSKQLVTRDLGLIVENAHDTLNPLLEVADQVVWIAGTEAHVGGLAEHERTLAGMWDHTLEKNGDKVHQHLRKIFGGYRFDLAHHANMGGLPWSEKNAANAIASRLIFEYAEWEEPLPHYAIRGHVHRVSDSGMNFKLRAFTAPCWCFGTSFIHRIGSGNKKPHIGSLLFKVRDGQMQEPQYLRYATTREGWQ